MSAIVNSFFLVLTLFSFSAFSGDNGGGQLNCKSSSGRTTLVGSAGVDYNGTGAAVLELTIDGATLKMDPNTPVSENTLLVDFVSYKHKKSYELVIKKVNKHLSTYDGKTYVYNSSVLKLESAVGSFKQIGPDRFTFKGVMPAFSTMDPRVSTDFSLGNNNFDKDIELNCNLDVSYRAPTL